MKKTSIYVGGTFDCFHAGHVNLLRRAREIADFVIVALNSDAFTSSYKGKPVMNELERLEVVRACRFVDLAFVMESHAMQRVYMELLRPDFILHGDDWTGDSLVRQLGIDDAFLAEHGIRMKYVPYTKGVSTSDIKRRILGVDGEKGSPADAGAQSTKVSPQAPLAAAIG
ncbi:MAG: FAD synthase [Planctomycetes bacterium]|nr:FAD synthase [Planctomycetota bacterium]